MTSPLDPNHPIDASGPDQVFYVDPTDTRVVTDGVTNSTTTVTSATAAFKPTDIGQAISGGSIPNNAVITVWNSATSVLISAAATASATGLTLTIGGHYPSNKFEDTEGVFGQGIIIAPVQANTSTATTGGTLAAATYYYVVTAVGVGYAGGETPVSNEKSQTTSGSTSTVTLTWAASAGAGGYKIYRATTSGAETLLTSVPAGTLTFVDTGALTPGTATPPTTNTALTYNSTAFVDKGTYTTWTPQGGLNGGTGAQKQTVDVNSRTVSDAVTNSTKTVTSATAAFGHGDLDSPITGSGIPAETVIVSVVNATTVTISNAATASASGVTIVIGGLPVLDGLGYGYPVYPAGPAYTQGTDGSYAVNADDTTGTAGHTTPFATTYGYVTVDGSVDQPFGAESNFPGTAGPGASGGVFTAAGSGVVGASTAHPITGVPDTLGWSGGASQTPTGAPIPSSYAITGGNELGQNDLGPNGVPIFNTDGFDTPGAPGPRTTTNTNFNHTGVVSNNGSLTALPSGYTITEVETLYGYPQTGYPGEAVTASGTTPSKPLSVSWVFGAGSATVSWSPPSSTGSNNIREYIVEGYQVKDATYIPTTVNAAAAFTNEPAVTWKSHSVGTFLAPPVQANITGSTSGGTLAAGTRFYVVTAVGTTGETIASNEKTIVNTGSTSSNAISWGAVTGAVSYNVYRTAGASGSEVLLKNVSGTTYTDTNADTAGTAVPPTVSTAVVPVTSARVEHLTPGFYYFFRVYARNDSGTGPMSDPVAGPSAPNNTPKYFMGYGMSGTTNTELDESALIPAELAADRI